MHSKAALVGMVALIGLVVGACANGKTAKEYGDTKTQESAGEVIMESEDAESGETESGGTMGKAMESDDKMMKAHDDTWEKDEKMDDDVDDSDDDDDDDDGDGEDGDDDE